MKIVSGLDKLYTKIEQNSVLSEDVYHYRGSYESIINILRSRRLRMSHFRDLPEEINHALSFFQENVRDIELQSLPGGLKTFWEAFEWYVNDFAFYITSFSLNRDDPNLWNKYGNDGSGFSIRFSKDHFRAVPANGVPSDEWFYGVHKVHYDDKVLDEFTKQINLKIHLLKIKPCLQIQYLVDLFSKMIPLLPMFKDEKYKLENEYRLFTHDHGKTENLKIPNKYKYQVEEKSKMDSDEIDFSHIKEVIVGPKNDFSKMENKIREDLKMYSFEVLKNLKITKSNYTE